MKTILLATVAATALSFPALAQAPKTFGPNENVQTPQSSSQQPAPMDKGAEGMDANAIPGVQVRPQPDARTGTVGSGPVRAPGAAMPGVDTNLGETYAPNENVQTPQQSSQDPEALEQPAAR
jgi:hypothetical protein